MIFTVDKSPRSTYIKVNCSPLDLPLKRPQRGTFLRAMPAEPDTKRAVSFIDGQNLFRHAKEAFGYDYPNYDPVKLSNAVCAYKGWISHGVRFYTGIPSAKRDPRRHDYWQRRFLFMKRAGVVVTSRPLRYQGANLTPTEKGIDMRLGLDVMRMAYRGELDVAIIFSQDQDFAEVAKEIHDISRSAGRKPEIVSAFPSGPTATSHRGIDNTLWFPMDRAFYDACLDPRDYRPRRKP